MTRAVAFLTLCLLPMWAHASDAETRLREARSLRCQFTGSAVTEFKNGVRRYSTIENKGTVTYDNIDLIHGSARILAATGANDLAVSWGAMSGLWFVEKAPFGNVIVTTVFPSYAAGTQNFIVIESRHWTAGVYLSGEQSNGTCTVLR